MKLPENSRVKIPGDQTLNDGDAAVNACERCLRLRQNPFDDGMKLTDDCALGLLEKLEAIIQARAAQNKRINSIFVVEDFYRFAMGDGMLNPGYIAQVKGNIAEPEKSRGRSL